MPHQPPAAPSRPDLEVRIERVGVLIAGARRLIGEGQALDLTVLGFAAADLRDAVRDAPAEASAGLAPRVIALQAALDVLAEEMTAASGAAARGVAAVARRSAFRAYDSGRKETDRNRRSDGSGAGSDSGSPERSA